VGKSLEWEERAILSVNPINFTRAMIKPETIVGSGRQLTWIGSVVDLMRVAGGLYVTTELLSLYLVVFCRHKEIRWITTISLSLPISIASESPVDIIPCLFVDIQLATTTTTTTTCVH
jgi:hypothetical protein